MDKALLKYEMSKNSITNGDLCKKLGMSRSAFYRKCNGQSDFTQREIQAIVDILKLESPLAIFFAK